MRGGDIRGEELRGGIRRGWLEGSGLQAEFTSFWILD